jgi:transformation/transcription domain-associated protein
MCVFLWLSYYEIVDDYQVRANFFLQFIGGFQIEMAMVHTTMRPLLLLLGDFNNLTLNRIQVLSSLTQLFPNTFNEKLCEQLLVSIVT